MIPESTTSRERLLHWQSPLPWALAAVGIGLAIPIAMGSWKLFLAGAGGLIVAYAILLRPELGLYLAAATVPLDAAGRLGNLLAHINISIAKIVLLVTLVAWAVHVVTRRARVLWARELTFLSIYLGFAVLSLIDTREFTLGYQAALRLAASILFYLLVVSLVRTREQLLRTLAILTAVSVLTFGFGLVQRYVPSLVFESRSGWEDPAAQTFGVEKDPLDAGASGAVARSSGVAYHAIIMAVNTDMMLPILFAAILIARSPPVLAVLWVGVGVTIAANLVTYSRIGVLLLALALVMLIARRILRLTPLRIVLAATAVLALIPFLSGSPLERVFSLQSYTLAGSESLRHRVDLLEAGWAAFTAHPLNGMGLETTYRIFDYYDYPDKTTIITVHNGYLQVALELGLFGITALLLFIGCTVRSYAGAARGFRQHGDRALAVLSESLLIGFIVFLVAGLTIDFMRIGFKNVWLMMALAPVLLRMSRNMSVLKGFSGGEGNSA